jgi:hypothetical protein
MFLPEENSCNQTCIDRQRQGGKATGTFLQFPDFVLLLFAQSRQMFKWKNWYGICFHKIRKIIARIRKMMISHFPIAHAILPINPRITNITAIMMNSIPSVKSQPKMFYHHWMSVHYL